MSPDEAHARRGTAVTLTVIAALIVVSVLLRAMGTSLWVSLVSAAVISGLLAFVVMRRFPARR